MSSGAVKSAGSLHALLGRWLLWSCRCGVVGTKLARTDHQWRANDANCLIAFWTPSVAYGDQAGGFAANADPLIQLWPICSGKQNPLAGASAQVEVVKGAAGYVDAACFRCASRLAALIRSAAVVATSSVLMSSLPSLLPSRWVGRALNRSPPARAKSASMLQYSSDTKASISASRSQISRNATDCTRPADRDPGNLPQDRRN